jgi:hypothetical protein
MRRLRRSLFPRLARRDGSTARVEEMLDRIARQTDELVSKTPDHDAVFTRELRFRLEMVTEQLDELLRQELSFTHTETWRTAYEVRAANLGEIAYFGRQITGHVANLASELFLSTRLQQGHMGSGTTVPINTSSDVPSDSSSR